MRDDDPSIAGTVRQLTYNRFVAEVNYVTKKHSLLASKRLCPGFDDDFESLNKGSWYRTIRGALFCLG
jgi:hypothetical protein